MKGVGGFADIDELQRQCCGRLQDTFTPVSQIDLVVTHLVATLSDIVFASEGKEALLQASPGPAGPRFLTTAVLQDMIRDAVQVKDRAINADEFMAAINGDQAAALEKHANACKEVLAGTMLHQAKEAADSKQELVLAGKIKAKEEALPTLPHTAIAWSSTFKRRKWMHISRAVAKPPQAADKKMPPSSKHSDQLPSRPCEPRTQAR